MFSLYMYFGNAIVEIINNVLLNFFHLLTNINNSWKKITHILTIQKNQRKNIKETTQRDNRNYPPLLKMYSYKMKRSATSKDI